MNNEPKRHPAVVALDEWLKQHPELLRRSAHEDRCPIQAVRELAAEAFTGGWHACARHYGMKHGTQP